MTDQDQRTAVARGMIFDDVRNGRPPGQMSDGLGFNALAPQLFGKAVEVVLVALLHRSAMALKRTPNIAPLANRVDDARAWQNSTPVFCSRIRAIMSTITET